MSLNSTVDLVRLEMSRLWSSRRCFVDNEIFSSFASPHWDDWIMTTITLAMGWTAPLWGQLQSFKFRQWLICMNSWIKGPLLCNLSLARSCIYAIVCWQSVSCSSLTSRCTPDKNANPVIQHRDQRKQWHLSGTMSDSGTNQLTVFLFFWLKMLWVGVKRNG